MLPYIFIDRATKSTVRQEGGSKWNDAVSTTSWRIITVVSWRIGTIYWEKFQSLKPTLTELNLPHPGYLELRSQLPNWGASPPGPP